MLVTKKEKFVIDRLVDSIAGIIAAKVNYNKARRKTRGQFVSNSDIKINADVNGAYQIMKKAKIMPPVKYNEKVIRLKVA